MPTVIDLGALGSQGFVIAGDDLGNQAGFTVSDAGDVNGDGFDDIILGAPPSFYSSDFEGSAYVIFGRADGFHSIDLGNLQAADGFKIEGPSADLVGVSVAGAGDINGDGFDDLIVGALGFGYSYYYSSSPTAYVIFGKSGPFATVDLDVLAASDGFVISDEARYGYGAFTLAAAGDVNGDGFDDIILGDEYANGFAGAAYVIFGKASGFGPVDLANLSSSVGFEITGAPGSYDLAGSSVSGAGDVNGDGFADIIVGADNGNNGGDGAGEAYVIFGKATGFGTIDLSTMAAGVGFTIQGDAIDDRAGSSVSAAGDINGDGFDDLIVGAPYGDNGGDYAGEAYVIFGKATGFGTIDLSSLAPGDGFIIQGDRAGDLAGISVSAAGDVNGDGFDDIIVGALYGDNAGGFAGQAYVIFGKASGFGTIDLSSLASETGFIIQGDEDADYAGFSVSAAGDIDGDGFADLLVGAPGNDDGGFSAGAAYVIFGRANFANDVRNDFNGDGRSDILWRSDSGALSDWLGQANGGFAINDANALVNVPTSWQVAGTGDFNGDSWDDILWRSDSGQLSNWLGTESGGFAINDANALTSVPTNWHVAGTGDFNNDGFDDILWRNDAGQLSDWLGLANGGFAINDANALTSVPTSWHVVGTGDFNGDGRDDILWRSDSGQLSNWLGTAAGGFANNDANAFGSAPTDWHIAGTGDFNGDGRDDILWRSDAGQLSNWLGQANGGFTNNDANAFATVPTSWQVVAVGDYNGDGFDDILWRSDSGQLSNWLGTASGGFTNNDANAFASVPTNWHTQPGESLV